MRSQRKVTIKLVEGGKLHNQRLVEYLANKFNERKVEV